MERVCACGCEASIEQLRPNAIYASDACKSRAWRRKSGYRVRGHRKPRQTPEKRRPGITVYFQDLRDLERLEVTVAACVAAGSIDGEDVINAMEAIAKALKRRTGRA